MVFTVDSSRHTNSQIWKFGFWWHGLARLMQEKVTIHNWGTGLPVYNKTDSNNCSSSSSSAVVVLLLLLRITLFTKLVHQRNSKSKISALSKSSTVNLTVQLANIVNFTNHCVRLSCKLVVKMGSMSSTAPLFPKLAGTKKHCIPGGP